LPRSPPVTGPGGPLLRALAECYSQNVNPARLQQCVATSSGYENCYWDGALSR